MDYSGDSLDKLEEVYFLYTNDRNENPPYQIVLLHGIYGHRQQQPPSYWQL